MQVHLIQSSCLRTKQIYSLHHLKRPIAQTKIRLHLITVQSKQTEQTKIHSKIKQMQAHNRRIKQARLNPLPQIQLILPQYSLLNRILVNNQTLLLQKSLVLLQQKPTIQVQTKRVHKIILLLQQIKRHRLFLLRLYRQLIRHRQLIRQHKMTKITILNL